MPVGDLPGWHQVFTDDFVRSVPLGEFPAAVADKWWAYPDGWPDTTGTGTYMPSRVVSIANGVMDLRLHTEHGIAMVAAPVPRVPAAPGPEGGLRYGRYAVRFRADPAPCYKTAWLLWPDSETWPRDGEIDFPEGRLTGTISAFLHHQGGIADSDQDAFDTPATYAQWHTAVIEWTPTTTRFLLDGTTVGTSTSRIPSTPMHWVLQTETGTDGCVPPASTVANVQIDWVTVSTRR
jgi:hypothetical protein